MKQKRELPRKHHRQQQHKAPAEAAVCREPEAVHEIRRDNLRAIVMREWVFGWTYRVVVSVTDRFHQEQPLTIPIFETELPPMAAVLAEARDWVAARLDSDQHTPPYIESTTTPNL